MLLGTLIPRELLHFAREFDGSTGFLDGGDVLDMNGESGMAMHAWFVTDVLAQNRNLITKWSGAGFEYLLCEAEVSGGSHMLAGFHGSAFPNGAGITTGVWHSGMGRFLDGAGCNVQLDGVELAGTGSSSLSDSGAPFLIGGAAGSGAVWDGKIAEVALWNQGTTDTLRNALWKGVSPLLVLPGPTLKAYYPLWGCADVEADLSGNKRNVTLNGTAPRAAGHAPVGPYCLSGVGI